MEMTFRQWIKSEWGVTDFIQVNPSDSVLDDAMSLRYGSSNGRPFLAWDNDYVYFASVYDGWEGVERVPRNPTTDRAEVINHVGGQ